MTHGHDKRRQRTGEYGSWLNMKTRCTNRNYKDWKRYGGAGITVCERWLHSFENFIADLGPKPSPIHSIDRINGKGNYEPSNCRWATPKEQRNNSSRIRANRICPNCSKSFYPRWRRTKFCTRSCYVASRERDENGKWILRAKGDK